MQEPLELRDPKNTTLTFKVSTADKKAIQDYVERKGWRMSAFLRVSVLKNMLEDIENEKK